MMAFEQDVIALRRDVDNLIKNQGNAGTITPEQILNALLTIDGEDSDLDADKLDGHHYSEILSLINAKLDFSAYTASDILSKLLTVDGSGSGLDSDKLDGHEYTDITTLISSKLDSSSYTAADILSKLLTVDGSGSGIDADKLDGYESSSFLLNSNYIESSYFGDSSGYIKFKNQVKICWGMVSITPSAANTPTLATVTFPITFSTNPAVMATAITTVPGTGVTGISTNTVSTTTVQIYLTRTNTTQSGVRWLAIGG